MRVALNWFDTGYRSSKRKPQQRSKAAAADKPTAALPTVPRKKRSAAPPAKAKAKTKSRRAGPPRVAVPSVAFDKLRDQAGWPDYERAWVRFEGERWWPFLVMEHAVTLLQGTKDLQDADVVVEFVREGGPIKP